MRDEFIGSIKSNQNTFGVHLSDDVVGRLADYYELVQEHNPILHLVGPSSPEDFATRHILESLTLLEFLPPGARFADIGPGAGLPSIPCLIARDDLHATLIESKEKKVVFLRAAVTKLGLDDRTHIVDRQFAEAKSIDVSYVTCRALDKFTQKLPQLLKWSNKSTRLLFGSKALGDELRKYGLSLKERLMPLSEQRFLFIAQPSRKTL